MASKLLDCHLYELRKYMMLVLKYDAIFRWGRQHDSTLSCNNCYYTAVPTQPTMKPYEICTVEPPPPPLLLRRARAAGLGKESVVSSGASSDALSLPRSVGRLGTSTRMLAPAWQEFDQPSCSRRFGRGGEGAGSIFQRPGFLGERARVIYYTSSVVSWSCPVL